MSIEVSSSINYVRISYFNISILRCSGAFDKHADYSQNLDRSLIDESVLIN